jgi:four helix bundle protein
MTEPATASASEYEQHIERMKKRTKDFALRVIKLFRTLPRDEAARIIGRQLLRSATSVGANYRAACRVRTGREFAAKIRIVCEESDESQYWMELLTESGIVSAAKLRLLHAEATELVAIFTKALDTTRRKLKPRH